MFEEGNTPIHVAIALNLREDQVNKYYREYWTLNGMDHLNQIYEEVGDNIWSVIALHRRMNTGKSGMNDIQKDLIYHRCFMNEVGAESYYNVCQN
jgi:hypothetical protein